jgi:imidazoleglycerol phosphate synthase glutamine amidotransferase subunit HisH
VAGAPFFVDNVVTGTQVIGLATRFSILCGALPNFGVLQAGIGRAQHETVNALVAKHDIGNDFFFVDSFVLLCVELQVQDGQDKEVFHFVLIKVAVLSVNFHNRQSSKNYKHLLA